MLRFSYSQLGLVYTDSTADMSRFSYSQLGLVYTTQTRLAGMLCFGFLTLVLHTRTKFEPRSEQLEQFAEERGGTGDACLVMSPVAKGVSGGTAWSEPLKSKRTSARPRPFSQGVRLFP